MEHEELMRLAIRAAEKGIAEGQTPFGATIARDGKEILSSHNEVWLRTDITAHAEVVAIQKACQLLGKVDLSDCVIYTTTEPCPMCFSAIHWARIPRVYFGTRIADAREAGFNELAISNEDMKSMGKSPVELVPDFLRNECLALFEKWKNKEGKKAY